MSFGKGLQSERLRRDITLESIAAGTKVPARHLRALEQDEYAQLPGGVFARGIVRSYCQFVGLDAEDWLSKLPPTTQEPEADWSAFAENVRRNRVRSGAPFRGRWLGVVLLLAAVVALAWAAWTYILAPRLQSLSWTPEAVSCATTLDALPDYRTVETASWKRYQL